MSTAMRLILLAGAALATMPAWGNDQLPQLPGGGASSLPTLGASSQDAVGMSDQSLSVTCYLGNPNDRQSLGSITVHRPEAAGSACNSFNYACRGRCYGCFSDFDMSEDICVDGAGRKYLR